MTKIEFWRSRCFRTAKEHLAQAAGVVTSQRKVKHEALQDAIDQAQTLCDLHEAMAPKPWAGPDPSARSENAPPTASLDHETCWHCLAAEGVKPCNVDGSRIPLCRACDTVAQKEGGFSAPESQGAEVEA